MELMTFIKQAWHDGEIFEAVHPSWPGSGVAPNGLGTLNTAVKGGGQNTQIMLTDGWPVSTADCVVANDVIRIAGEVAVYMVVISADSNGAGEVSIEVNPPLRSVPADNAILTTTDVSFQVTILDRSRFEPSRAPSHFSGYRVTFVEALL